MTVLHHMPVWIHEEYEIRSLRGADFLRIFCGFLAAFSLLL
jgi:hypothetical protein